MSNMKTFVAEGRSPAMRARLRDLARDATRTPVALCGAALDPETCIALK